jgi:hypothetical protein
MTLALWNGGFNRPNGYEGGKKQKTGPTIAGPAMAGSMKGKKFGLRLPLGPIA